jgi:DNA modification methylase
MTQSDDTQKTHIHVSQGDVAAFIAEHGTPYDPDGDDYRRPPFASPVKAGKNTPIYNAHSYHTKVPPQGIVPYIKHYTKPGDLVLDPFCGSGMTGVACLLTGRQAILNDLSPAATHIAHNYCTPVDVDALQREFERVQDAVKEEFDWLYGTICDRCGGPATIQYTIWSDVFECGRCGEELVLWNVAVDHESGKVQTRFTCPLCNATWRKLQVTRLRSDPVLTVYHCPSCQPGRAEHLVTESEMKRLTAIEDASIPYWYPDEQIDAGREMMRHGLLKRGLTRTPHFYTKRNLWAFARLWHESERTEAQLKSHFQFVLTAILHRATLLNRLRPSRAGDPLSGTLYVSALIREDNVGQLFSRKFSRVVKALPGITHDSDVIIHSGSATDLRLIPTNSVDYVFTDPPFGQNIFYADCSMLWESWLQLYTNEEQEIVCNDRRQDGPFKTVADYGRLMMESFREIHRILKPGRWASIVFHNSDDRIWQVILDAAEQTGLELVEVNSFDKKQLSFKGVRGDKGLERVTNKDIVLNLYKPRPHQPRSVNGAPRREDLETQIVQQVADFLATNPPPTERTLQHIWNHVLYDMLSNGSVQVSMADVDRMLPYDFKQVDGRWYLRGEAIAGGRVFGIRDETDAIAWLTAVLASESQTTGEIIPKWQEATHQASDAITKNLDQILAENFWQDRRTSRWRIPTTAEREKMSASQQVADHARMRQIRRYLTGELDLQPSDVELCGWIQFAYEQEMYKEAVQLFGSVHQPNVDETLYHNTRKIVKVCRMRAGRMSNGEQLTLL